MPDTAFDDLFERFQRKIYGDNKGRIREEVVAYYLDSLLAQIKPDTSRVQCADLGGGLGQVTHTLLARGYRVDYCDLSPKMAAAAERDTTPELRRNARFFHGPLQSTLNAEYQFVHCQAVLEWLEEPMQGLQHIARHVQRGAHLMLIFYNAASIVFRNLIRGNLYAAQRDIRGDGKGLTPINPLHCETVFETLSALDFTVERWFGVRTFSDYQEKPAREQLSLPDLVSAELAFSERDPYRAMARYIGVIARRNENSQPAH